MTATLIRPQAHRAAGTSPVLELRTRALADTDARLIRANEDAEERRFVGHAAVFNSRTAIGNPLRWGWYEEIASAAFDKTLQEGDARFLIDHNSALLVARVTAGDLTLATDDIGLGVDAGLDEQLSYVRDLVRNLEKRRITGMSFGFYVVRDTWTTETVETSDGNTAEVDVRVIDEVRLLEVSAVTFPAYEDTDAGLRAMTDEVRAARGITRDSLPPREREQPAPPVEGTRADDPAPAEATQGSAHLARRHQLLAARYRITA